MAEHKKSIAINVIVEITTDALDSIVENVKKQAGLNDKGYYNVDTADKVSEMISRFLFENDFESYTKNIDNYSIEK